MTHQQVEHLIGFAQNSSYNAPAKGQFEKLAMKLLREVRTVLEGKNNSDIRVSFNQGGIAVSGEATLHSDRVYIQIASGALCGNLNILVRAVTGKQDYTGKANHYYRPEDLLEFGANGLAQFAKSISETHTGMNWSMKPVCDACGGR